MLTRGSSRLSSKKRKELMVNLCRCLSGLKSPEEVAEALTDLLGHKEVETIAKRLQIAEMLALGKDYASIRNELRVGFSTIARVNTWLNLSGKGYQLMFQRRKKSPQLPTNEQKYDPLSWHNFKRRYSMCFWPQLVLEEFLKNANQEEKRRVHDVLDKLNIKRQQFRSEKNKQLYDMFSKNF